MKKLLSLTSLFAVIIGIILLIGGVWGIVFTYKNIAQENIVTPSDASLPGQSVRGPWTLKSQADIIRHHTLDMTGGKTYAEMPRQIPKLDMAGNPVLDADGNQIMIANDARNIWITATTLITALNLGIITYVFSALIFLFGLISVWTGIVFFSLSTKH